MSPRAFNPEDAAKGLRGSVARNARLRKERWEEIYFLLRTGHSPEEAARRVGVSLGALARQAYRHDEIDDVTTRLFGNAYDKERDRRSTERRRV